jgi:acetyl-CoA acetyltransferase
VTAAIVGVGETAFSRKDGRPVTAIAVEAVRRALDDAGLEPSDVDGFVTEASSMTRRAPIDQVASALGVERRTFSAQTSLAGAGVVGALQLAQLGIDAGLASVVVSYYAISLSARTGGVYAHHAEDPLKAALEMPFGFYGQPVYWAAMAQRYAHEYGLDPKETGAVALAARDFASRTPGAMKREPLTMNDYLDAPIVSTPLRTLDCCLMNDGGAAFVVTSLDRARTLRQKPVVIAGTGFGAKPVTEADFFTQGEDYLSTGARYSGPAAFVAAGLRPDDVDLAEIYDCFSISVIVQLEDLGFVPRGEGAAAVGDGLISRGGSLPANTHGGLLSHSFTVGASHIAEAVRQLRGQRGEAQIDDVEVALVAGLGAQDHATAIFAVDR